MEQREGDAAMNTRIAARAALTVLSMGLLGPTWADVRVIEPSQSLQTSNPDSDTFDDVAIDGGYIIALAHSYDGKQSAYLYRRSVSTGKFALLRTLLETPAPYAGGDVAMKNGIAAVRIGTRVTIFENSGGTYVPGHTAAPLTHPGGLAISGKSVIVGGDGCSYDAVIYQKGTDGNWGVTGRIDDHQGDCHPEGLLVDLNYDYALVTVPHADHATAWRRNGTALDWLPAGTLTLPAGADAGNSPFVLENSTAVAPDNYAFRRSGSTWTRTSRAQEVAHDADLQGVQVVDRDGLLLSVQTIAGSPTNNDTHVFEETTPGHFENSAILNVIDPKRVDVSARTAVVISDTISHGGFWGPPYDIDIFDLPSPVSAPPPVVDDFENGNITDFTFYGGQFALASRGSNHVLAQGNSSGLAIAVANDSESATDQIAETDFTTANSNSDSWVGLVAKYVDANNFYYLAVYNNLTFRLYKRVNGVDTLLRQSTWRNPRPVNHVKLSVSSFGTFVSEINGDGLSDADDTTFTHGRAGLATFQTRADFDNVRIAGNNSVGLLYNDFVLGPFNDQNFTEVGGQWQEQKDAQNHNAGFAQLDSTVYALASTGVPLENQQIDAIVRLDSFNSSTTSGWVGLLARYQDPQNYYYVAIRSKNQIQIRKVVNGVTTILAAAPFTAQPGVDHHFVFSTINDQLHLVVDGVLLAAAHDDTFISGQYGMGTYRATATWKTFSVMQP
jgi:hypothetical protein